MFNSGSSSSSSSHSESHSKARASNSLVINGADAPQAAELYASLMDRVKSDIVGKALVKVSTMEVGLFQLQNNSKEFSFYEEPKFEFFFGFLLNGNILSGSFEVEFNQDNFDKSNRMSMNATDYLDTLVVDELVQQVGFAIANRLRDYTAFSINKFSYDLPS
jgi:hypothetical protein